MIKISRFTSSKFTRIAYIGGGETVGNLSRDVFERRKSTGRGLFAFVRSFYAQIQFS